MTPSLVREILKTTERPGLISLAGGLPAPEGFPVEAVREACERVLRDTPYEALQYASSEGFGPLREWVAQQLRRTQGMQVSAAQVLITTGSQQGLDLLGKVLIDPGSAVAVESPTYLGALQAFAPQEPEFLALPADAEGPTPDGLAARRQARFAYLLPSFQNPSGCCLGDARRQALAERAASVGLPLVEDDPYGELWYDAPPPSALAARWPEGVAYLGSFSKLLAPGLRLGYVVAPAALGAKLLHAKQAADLHSPSLNQRVVHRLVSEGLLDTHLPALRQRYRAQRDAMAAALRQHLPPGCEWQTPAGGMFFWVRWPHGTDTLALLSPAVARGVAFVPGAAFEPQAAGPGGWMRLSFATASVADIERGVQALSQAWYDTRG